MTELEIAFVGLVILLGAAGIVYAGVKGQGDKKGAIGDADAPGVDSDQSGAGASDGGAV